MHDKALNNWTAEPTVAFEPRLTPKNNVLGRDWHIPAASEALIDETIATSHPALLRSPSMKSDGEGLFCFADVVGSLSGCGVATPSALSNTSAFGWYPPMILLVWW